MKPSMLILIFQANAAEPALPGRRCCPLAGGAANGRFGGGHIHG